MSDSLHVRGHALFHDEPGYRRYCICGNADYGVVPLDAARKAHTAHLESVKDRTACASCGKPIDGPFITVRLLRYHTTCAG